MVRRAARITHDQGNRRFHQYVFMQIGDDILNMSLLPAEEREQEEPTGCFTCGKLAQNRELRPNEFIVYEDCPDCGNQVKVIRKNPDFHHSTEGVNERRFAATRIYR